MYVYKYTVDGKPMTHCPECREDLTKDKSVEIELTDGKITWCQLSNLDQEGVLQDPTNEVAEGQHSGTICTGCSNMLINMDGVEEENLGE